MYLPFNPATEKQINKGLKPISFSKTILRVVQPTTLRIQVLILVCVVEMWHY